MWVGTGWGWMVGMGGWDGWARNVLFIFGICRQLLLFFAVSRYSPIFVRYFPLFFLYFIIFSVILRFLYNFARFTIICRYNNDK